MNFGELDAGLNALDVVRISRAADGTPTALIVDGAPVELAAGPEGPAGAVGPAGPEGPAGPAGASFVGSFAVATKAAAQNMTGAFVKVAFDNAFVDPLGWINTTLNRIVPKEPGWYQVTAFLWLNSRTTIAIDIRKNGTRVQIGQDAQYVFGVGMTAFVYCNGTTDYLELFAFAANGTGVGTGVDLSYLSALRIG